MKKRERTDKPLRDLIEIIHFTENVSAKIHGKENEAEIYRTVKKEFGNSKSYNASILLTDDGTKLRIAETSITPRKVKAGEKASGLRLRGYEINLNKSSIYSQVVHEGKTVQVNASDIIGEWIPRPLAHLVSKITGYENRPAILTPLKRHEKIIGVLAVSSTSLAEHFIPSVKNLAQHISNAIELVARERERKKMEETLKESEQKLRDIIDTSPDAIVWTDTSGKITLVNRKGFELTGFSKKELIGKNFVDVEALTQESKEKILESFMKRIQGVDSPPYEVEVVGKNGEIIPVELSASAIYEGDKIVGTQSIFRDLRERKKMEERLKEYSEHLEELVQKRTEELLESEKRYSVLVEEARDGVAIIQDAKLMFTNSRLAEIVGYSRDELIGMSFLKLADEKYRQLVKERYERRLRGEEIPATYEAVAIAKNDERVPIELSATRIDYQGHPADLVIVRDIRERKRMEEERLKLERLAAIGEIATMVGHDLRNPLQSIENATYYLSNEIPFLVSSIPIPQKTMDMLRVISDSVQYADRIVKDLHDFASPKKPAHTKTKINTLMKETLSRVEAPENVEITAELGKLPEIRADKDMVKRVFVNLVENAIQSMQKGGRLKVSTKKTEESVEVSFKDTGTGISKDNMEKLFTPFFTTKAKGIGMGLAICKKLIESHGGSIEAESEEGKGTIFTVKLPIQQKMEVKTIDGKQNEYPHS